MGKNDITITLKIDDALYANPEGKVTGDNLNYCHLSDDNTDIPSTGSGTDFESNVYIDKNVTWQGDHTDNNSCTVKITGIVYEPNIDNDVDFFSGETNQSPGNSGKVKYKVKDSVTQDQMDVYTIQFSVALQPPNNIARNYSIDPKLKAHSNT